MKIRRMYICTREYHLAAIRRVILKRKKKSDEWGTQRRNCRRGREWCFPDGGPRGSAGWRTQELTSDHFTHSW